MTSMPQRQLTVMMHELQGRKVLIKRDRTFEVDEVGLFIWDLCDGAHTVEDIANAVTDAYDIDHQTALNDCREFIEELTHIGLLV